MHKSRAKALKMAAVDQPVNVYHTRHANKTAVFGILDRESRQVGAKVVPNVKRETLQNEILKNIHHGSAVYSDRAVAYDKLKETYIHDTVNHVDAYVKGNVHTNGLENFWSLMKRNLPELTSRLSRSIWTLTLTNRCFASTIAQPKTIRLMMRIDSYWLYRRFQGRD